MGGVPKKRHSKSKVGRRRAHLKLEPQTFSRCQNCAQPTLSHRVCLTCGWYGGRVVMVVKPKKEKKKKK